MRVIGDTALIVTGKSESGEVMWDRSEIAKRKPEGTQRVTRASKKKKVL